MFTLGNEVCNQDETPDELETLIEEEIEKLNAEHELKVEQLRQKSTQNTPTKGGGIVDIMVESLWTMAQSRKDNETLKRMLQFDYLPQTCLKKARAIKDETVRCAYLNRKDTGNRKELLQTETRSKVYASICDLAETDPDVAQAIKAKLQTKPTLILGESVLRSGITQTEILVLAIDFLSKNSSGGMTHIRTENISKALHRSAKDFRLLAKCLMTNGDTSALDSFSLSVANRSDLNEYVPTLVQWFEVDALTCLRARKEKGQHYFFYGTYKQSLCHVVELLTKVLNPANNPCEQYVSQVRNFLSVNWIALNFAADDRTVGRIRELAGSVNYTPNYTMGKLVGLAARGAKSKGAELRKVTGKLVTYIQGDHAPSDYMDLLIAVVSNVEFYSLPEKLREPVMQEANETVLCCALTLNPGVELLTEMVLHSIDGLSDDALSIVNIADKDMTRIVDRLLLDNSDLLEWGRLYGRDMTDKINNILRVKPSKEVYRLIPWAAIGAVCITPQRGRTSQGAISAGEHGLTMICELLHESLGEETSKWESFSNLADSWTGNFGELLDAARLL